MPTSLDKKARVIDIDEARFFALIFFSRYIEHSQSIWKTRLPVLNESFPVDKNFIHSK